jgi:hypothetical protein
VGRRDAGDCEKREHHTGGEAYQPTSRRMGDGREGGDIVGTRDARASRGTDINIFVGSAEKRDGFHSVRSRLHRVPGGNACPHRRRLTGHGDGDGREARGVRACHNGGKAIDKGLFRFEGC